MSRRAAEGSQPTQQHQDEQERAHETAQPSIMTAIMLEVGRRLAASGIRCHEVHCTPRGAFLSLRSRS